MNTATMERPSQIEYATITVAYVNAPKPGQKSASIKDTDGVYFWIKPADMPNYVPGVPYEISYVTTQSNGYTNRTIKSAEPVEQQRHAEPAPRTQAARSPAPATQRSAPVPRDEPPRQSPPNGNGNGHYRPTSPKDARRMFLCASFTAFVKAGRVERNRDAMAETLDMLSEVYDEKIGIDDAAT